jgi:hypothetical protein
MSNIIQYVLVLLGALLAFVVYFKIYARREANLAKRQEALMRSRNSQRLTATVRAVISIYQGSHDQLMVACTSPETGQSVTVPAKNIPYPYPKVGDTVYILVHPEIREVWIDEQPTT